jgi:hypothetical protein
MVFRYYVCNPYYFNLRIGIGGMLIVGHDACRIAKTMTEINEPFIRWQDNGVFSVRITNNANDENETTQQIGTVTAKNANRRGLRFGDLASVCDIAQTES